MRYSLACPACGGGTGFVVVGGELQAACRRCAARAAVRRGCCEGAPPATALTDAVADAPCDACGDVLTLLAGPIRAPTALVEGESPTPPEPRWGGLRLTERAEASPYRDGRRTGLTLERPPVGAPQVLLVAVGFGWPALPIALFGEAAWALGWLAGAALFACLLVFGARPVRRLHADVGGVRVRHGGFLARLCSTDASSVRRVFWAGRGARCAVWAQTESDHVLVFDGLDPRQAASLEHKLEQILGLDVEDRSLGAEARA